MQDYKTPQIKASIQVIYDAFDNSHYLQINSNYPIRISKTIASQVVAQLTKTN